LKDANLLEPFVLMTRPDAVIVKEYIPYYKAHRRTSSFQYMDEFVVPKIEK